MGVQGVSNQPALVQYQLTTHFSLLASLSPITFHGKYHYSVA
jgi:hypothetical protein